MQKEFCILELFISVDTLSMNQLAHNDSIIGLPRQSTCPVCSHQIAVLFLDPALQPLAPMACPQSPNEAKPIRKLLLDFVRPIASCNS